MVKFTYIKEEMRGDVIWGLPNGDDLRLGFTVLEIKDDQNSRHFSHIHSNKGVM